MHVPLVDLQLQTSLIREELDAAIGEVLDTGHFVLGPKVSEFERAFAEAVEVEHAVAVNSGTSALQLALLASGIKPGEEVIIPSMTFVATAAAVIYCGATPVVIDVDPQTLCLDPSRIAAAITDRTFAVMPVHLHGRVAQMTEILEIASQAEIQVIEDSAQAHLANRDGQYAGSIGLAAGFSFYPGKNLGAAGEGGMVTTNSDEIAQQVRLLRDWGSAVKYDHSILGFNMRMEAMQGAVLGVKLRHLNAWTERRIELAHRYDEALRREGFRTPVLESGVRNVYHVYETRVAGRDEALSALQQNGVGAGCHYPRAVHEQVGYKGLVRVSGSQETSERFARESLSLPLFPEMTHEQQDFVIEQLLRATVPAE